MLTKNLRKYILKLRDGRNINITQGQKEAIWEWIKEKIPMIEIKDVDTSEVLYSGKTSSIDEIVERKFDNSFGLSRYVCDYGTRHMPNENCECKKRFKCFSGSMQNWLIDRGNKIFYDSDITESMQREFIYFLNINNISWYNPKSIEYNK